jgi:hexosaminidase
MRTYLSLMFIWLSTFGSFSETLPSPLVILPQPQKVELIKGSGLEPGKLEQIFLKGNFKRPVMGELLSQLIIRKTAGKGTLELILDTTFTSIPSREGYLMTISGGQVEIKARGEAGLFYGCQSLEQLLEDARNFRKPIPACKITDYPALSYRAVHWDVKHHLDHINYYYESIDRLARYKINAVVFEFEDKLRYQRQPLVGAPQAISIDEMAALTRYARERHIEITPLVQGLGHATFILKHQQYTNLREIPWNRWAFCPLNEGTYQVLFDLYRDAIDATPGSKYLHIGGDEVWNIGLCPRCKPTCDKQGRTALNLYWLKRVCEFAKENNRIPIFWDDMPFQTAGLLESIDDDKMPSVEVADKWAKGIPKLDSLLADFPRNCIYMRWNYSMARQDGNIRALDWYKSRGLSPMVATSTSTSSEVANIRSFIQLAAERKIDGMLCTAWDDSSPHMETFWRGFIASAEYSWSPNGRSLEKFNLAWMQREFGISVQNYSDLNKLLNNGFRFWKTAYYRDGSRSGDDNSLQSIAQLEHWLPLVEGMEKRCFDYTTKLIELPDLNSPGSWSLKYKDRLDQAALEADQYSALSATLTELNNNSKKNRYFWEISEALYDLHSSTPHILLALKECDSPNKDEQKAGFEKLKKAMDEFQKTWAQVESVYSQTRFISYPPNYVPDRYFHSASQREDLTWMIQAEEMYFGMIDKWMKSKK